MNREEFWSYIVNKCETDLSDKERHYKMVRSLCGEIWVGGIWSYFSNCGHQYEEVKRYLVEIGKVDLVKCMDDVRVLLYDDKSPKTEDENRSAMDGLYGDGVNTEEYDKRYDAITDDIHWDIIRWTEEVDNVIEKWAVENALHD